MARRQMQIAGTERSDIPPELDEAGAKWLDLRKEARRATERKKEAKFSVIALMQAHKIKIFKHRDEETGEEVSLKVELEPKLTASKSGEPDHEASEGGGMPEHAGGASDGVHAGLIAQAEKAQLDAGVSVSSDGDVVPPDVAAPKKKPARKRGK